MNAIQRPPRLGVSRHVPGRNQEPGRRSGGNADHPPAACVGEITLDAVSTNPIESALSVVEEKRGRVKKWQGGDMKLRWVASGLLFVERRFRRVKGYREIPQLMAALQAAAPPGQSRPVAVAKKVG